MTVRDDVGPVPPDDMVQRYSGSATGDKYVAIGRDLLSFLVHYAELKPHYRILDVGCGIGLAARPLIGVLEPSGSYDGFDVMPEPIEWCQQHYRALPQFRFVHADVHNEYYNPLGRIRANEYSFPYPDARFDIVVLTSVFTHLLPPSMAHYLEEVARVMKPGARCLITYFLLNPESLASITQWVNEHPQETDHGVPGSPAFPWQYNDECRIHDKDAPEKAVAYSESWMRHQYAQQGLIIERIQYGEWCRGSLQPGWQDAVLASKRQ